MSTFLYHTSNIDNIIGDDEDFGYSYSEEYEDDDVDFIADDEDNEPV